MIESTPRDGALSRLHQDLKQGRISRRTFVQKAIALGAGLPVAAFIANSTTLSALAAQESATPAAGASPGIPSFGTETQQRGAGGELKILVAQAPSALSIHAASGGADIEAATLITEPLLSYGIDGTLVPMLAAEVPSVENGGVAADLTSVTFKLLPDVIWSDGQPFTADDVVFTWQWVIDEANQSIDQTTYEVIDSIEAIDPLTAKVTFKTPTLAWYIPFTSANRGGIYPKHFWDGQDAQKANDAFRSAPIGTGPFVVDTFSTLDQVIYKANDNYREPNKPYFASVNMKGSTDAVTSVVAVISTGDWDIADNPQITPDVMADLLKNGTKGTVYGLPGPYVEKLDLNFSDPRKTVDDQKSEMNTPHPYFSDPAVRNALSLGIDRDTISTRFYDGPPIEPPGVNILSGIAAFDSGNTSWTFNIDQAKQTLEDAGWTLNGNVRSKDGVELELDYVTTINDVRQKTQAVLKDAWEEIGFKVNLKQVDGGIFFDSSAGNDQNFTHFYSDLQMYTDGPTSTFPLAYMQYWYAGKDGENICQKSNNWSGTNKIRYNNPEYDALFDQLSIEIDADAAASLFVQLNDIIINEFVEIPIVQREAQKYAASSTLRRENIAESTFEGLLWNIANWNRVES